MATTRLSIFGIVAGLIVLPFVPQIPGCVMANTAKIGKVVNAETGQGMRDVFVIAAARFYAESPIHGSAHNTPYRIITHTDSDGNYKIPSTWGALIFGLPGTHARENWLITAFKPGYALVGEDAAWSEFDSYGMAKRLPRSTIEPPPAQWLGLVIDVAPLKMREVPLSLQEAVAYYERITGAGSYSVARREEELMLSNLANSYFLPKVCDLAPDEKLAMPVGAGVLIFTANPDKSTSKLRELEPEGWQGPDKLSSFHAGNVCIAMKAGEL